jgi:hypothetical protein
MGPRTSLEVVEKRKKPSPAEDRTPVFQPVAIRTELSRLLMVDLAVPKIVM